MAADVKFSGEYYAASLYLDKGAVQKDVAATNISTAFYFQRLRLNTTFIVHPGLMLITRADIMERIWGASRSDFPQTTALDTMSAGSRPENENIAFDLAYVMYISPIGIFLAGYQIDGAWGLTFGNTSLPTGKIGYMFRGGPVTLGIQTGKNNEFSRRNLFSSVAADVANNNAVDRDSSFYTAYGIYAWKGGQAGLLYKHIRSAASRSIAGDTGAIASLNVLTPYAKAQLGPVALEAQIYYLFGDTKWEGNPGAIGQENQYHQQYTAFVDALGDFGMFYAGGSAAYLSGDDPGTRGKVEGGTLTGGLDWNPCLIMFNQDLNYFAGARLGANNTTTGSPMSNAYFLQARAGVRPIDKLDIMASVAWAYADKTPAGQWQSRHYGYEVDVTATYKITNNLSYMLGGGYMFTGEWYKGVNAAGTNELTNNFLVINKLTLTF
jgi:hypothetical protein